MGLDQLRQEVLAGPSRFLARLDLGMALKNKSGINLVGILPGRRRITIRDRNDGTIMREDRQARLQQKLRSRSLGTSFSGQSNKEDGMRVVDQQLSMAWSGDFKCLIKKVLLGYLLIMGLSGPYQAFGPGMAAAGETISPAAAKSIQELPAPYNKSEVHNDLKALLAAYRDDCTRVEVTNNRLLVILRLNQRLIYDDGRPKSPAEKLDQPDLQDMLSQPYPLGRVSQPIQPDLDPGRFRVGAFFAAVYGASPKEVQNNLVPVNFCGQRVFFNKKNGAAQALAAVGLELQELLQRRPELRQYIFPLGGLFNWRPIAGTERLSPHGWGIAIDLNPKKGAYWRGSRNMAAAASLQLQQGFPFEIVEIFERHGFIWGGKWWHYDLMHFEYRPELINKAKLRSKT